jgi:hypothetical protein
MEYAGTKRLLEVKGKAVVQSRTSRPYGRLFVSKLVGVAGRERIRLVQIIDTSSCAPFGFGAYCSSNYESRLQQFGLDVVAS